MRIRLLAGPAAAGGDRRLRDFDPYKRAGTWRPTGANEANLATMAVDPGRSGARHRRGGRHGLHRRRRHRPAAGRPGEAAAGYRRGADRSPSPAGRRRQLMPDHPFPDAAEDQPSTGPDRQAAGLLRRRCRNRGGAARRPGGCRAAGGRVPPRRHHARPSPRCARCRRPGRWSSMSPAISSRSRRSRTCRRCVEPDVRVLVVGDREDVGFYRQLTRGLGVADVPLQAADARHGRASISAPWSPRRRFDRAPVRGGRLLTVTGVRGGVGATTIAANLAWHLGSVAHRHTVLLDADLHRGTPALLLGAQAGPGLRNALETPGPDRRAVRRARRAAGRRAAARAGRRGERWPRPLAYAPGAAERLSHAAAALQFHPHRCAVRRGRLHRDLLDAGASAHPGAGADAGLRPRHAAAAGTAERAGPGQPAAAGAEPRRTHRAALTAGQVDEALKLDARHRRSPTCRSVEEAASSASPRRGGRVPRGDRRGWPRCRRRRRPPTAARRKRPAAHGSRAMSNALSAASAAATASRSEPGRRRSRPGADPEADRARARPPDAGAPITNCARSASAQSIRPPSPPCRPRRWPPEVERLIAEIATAAAAATERRANSGSSRANWSTTCSASARWSRCWKTTRSPTSWSTARTRSSSSGVARSCCPASASATPSTWPTSASASPPRSAAASMKAARWWMRG